MILLLDLGNTNLYIGIYQNKTLICEFRTDTDLNRSADMYFNLIHNFLINSKINPQNIDGSILSSVIPSLTDVISLAIYKLTNKKCLLLNCNIKTDLSIKIDFPSELGSDLIADSVGAISKYGYHCIISDLGTASKVMIIDKNGNFLGVSIAPGIKLASKALSTSAALLTDIDYKAPKSVIGKNTHDALNSGTIYGHIGLIEGLTNKIEEELGYKTKHILTGGNAILIKDYINNYHYDPNLIFEGLYQIYIKNTY